LKNKTEIAVGAMTIIGITAFILGYKFLKGEDIFTRSHTVVVAAERANNLMPSNLVYENGVAIGSVSEVSLSTSPNFMHQAIFVLKLNSDVVVPKDSKFKIYGLDPLGKMGITLLRGKETEMASIQDTLLCYVGGNAIDEGVGVITALKPKLDSLLGNVNTLIENMTVTLGKGENSLLTKAVNDLSSTLKSVNKMTENLNSTLDREKDNLHGILTNVNELTAKFNAESDKLDSILSNFQTISGKLAGADLEGIIGSAKTTLEELQSTLKKVNEGDGSIAKLLNEDGAYQDITKTINTLNDLLSDIKSNPKKYISLSLIDRSKYITVDNAEDSARIASGKKIK
jgi:phospholipid/cholesterol/gamma-HCH transport system substrate-binding protein